MKSEWKAYGDMFDSDEQLEPGFYFVTVEFDRGHRGTEILEHDGDGWTNQAHDVIAYRTLDVEPYDPKRKHERQGEWRWCGDREGKDSAQAQEEGRYLVTCVDDSGDSVVLSAHCTGMGYWDFDDNDPITWGIVAVALMPAPFKGPSDKAIQEAQQLAADDDDDDDDDAYDDDAYDDDDTE